MKTMDELMFDAMFDDQLFDALFNDEPSYLDTEFEDIESLEAQEYRIEFGADESLEEYRGDTPPWGIVEIWAYLWA